MKLALSRTPRFSALGTSFTIQQVMIQCAAVGLCAGISAAGVLHVPGDARTIEAGLALAEPFDTVLVAPGLYEPATPLVFDQPHVTLLSEVPREAILGVGHIIFEQTIDILSAECVIEGFAIYSAPPCVRVGDNAGLARIENNLFYGIGWYTAIYAVGSGTTIAGNEFFGCMEPIATSDPQTLIEGNTFSWNMGGVYMTGGGTIRGNIFENNANYADYGEAGSGGAILVWSPEAPVVIEENRIEANRTDAWYPEGQEGRGGGIFVYGAADATIRGNRIVGNQSLNGAGLYAEESGLVVEGNLFAANADSVRDPNNPLRGCGGGLYLKACTGNVTANTIAGNTALVEAGGIYIEGPAAPIIERNIVASNRSDGAGIFCAAADPWFACNDAWSNATANYGGCADPTGQNGNLSADPLFCPPFFGEFTLRDDSPCAPENAPPECGRIGAFDVGCAAMAVENPAGPRPPMGLRVHPNPALERVTIILDGAPPGAPVTIEIRDVAGRRVTTLRGDPAVTWDRTNAAGMRVAPGIYFVAARSGRERSAQAKLLLLR